MLRSFVNWQNSRWLVALAGMALVWVVLGPESVPAQSAKSKKTAPELEKKSGKIAEIEKKGKAATLTIEEADGEKFDVQLTPKSPRFVVNGKGDIGFFKHANVFVSSESVVRNAGNNYLFGNKFTIHIGGKPPAQRFEQDPANPAIYHIAGPVVDCTEDSFTFDGGDSPYKVGFEQGVVSEITIESTEPEHATVGADVEVEGVTRGGKFLPSSVVVTLDRPLVADEVFGHDKKGKSKAAAKAAAAKKTAKGDKADKSGDKTGDDSPAADAPKPSADPFNVLGDNKKDAKKGKTAPPPKKDKKPAADSDSGN
jgi:hypothetical protein